MNQRTLSITNLDTYDSHLINADSTTSHISHEDNYSSIMASEQNSSNEMLQGKRPDTKDYTAINLGDDIRIDSNFNLIKTLSPWSGSPPSRRIKRYAYGGLAVFAFVLFILVIFSSKRKGTSTDFYTEPMVVSDRTEFPLVAVADRDSFSFDKDKHIWKSVLLRGMLKRDSQGKYSVSWQLDKQVELKGKLAEQKRGLELSELKRYNGKLYTFDDRTGIVYEILSDNTVIGRHILPDGDGNSPKGFKCEWATVKDGKLWVGSIGKEWTTGTGQVIGRDPMWVKTIDANGKVEHVNFVANYEALRDAVGATYPGYLVHEAAEWSEFHKRWYFLPRRESKEKYDENEDVKRGSNVIISASEDFSHVTFKRIGTVTPTRGFSTMKFIPGRPNEIVAIKSEEEGERMRSYITVFSLDGKVLMEETAITDEKVEGLEIL